ncbi:SsgA family sporulation/cell division regulator [Streptomyces sp. NPDC052016]|uniref:SsgA family sporulation/cell division regulator n=1 Tax=Streptomyces sp. NPDC052016 TaxID=3365680 RepID=UPI0037CD8798
MRKCHLTVESTHWVARRLPVPINCEFSFHPRDPYAVTLIFDAEGERPVRWVFARELLAEGLTATAGQGDVAVWLEHDPDGASSMWVEVGNALHKALFEIPGPPIAQWLASTYALVPRGQEMVGVDWEELTQLTE